MCHVVGLLFDTFAFIFTQLPCSETIMPAGKLPLNQLFAIIDFVSHFNFKSISVLNIKDIKNFL